MKPEPSTTPNNAGAPVGNISSLTERDLIARIQSQLPPRPEWMPVGIGDDAAVVEPERNRLEVLTVDAVIDGVHFDRRFTPPSAIGHRALAVNLSDLAAMGATPRLALLSMALPPDLPVVDFDALVHAFTVLAATHRLHVAGGNLTRTPGPLVIDVTVIGSIKRRRALTRAGARVGDDVYVTGTIGAAAAGLQMLQRDGHNAAASNTCIERYLRPEPRVRMGQMLARNGAASACMDLSDGLEDGLRQISAASGVGIVVDGDQLPIDGVAREWFTAAGVDPVDAACAGGDDYELLFTVRPRMKGRLRQALRHGAVPITRIGACTAERTLTVTRTRDGRSEAMPLGASLSAPGFRHFR